MLTTHQRKDDILCGVVVSDRFLTGDRRDEFGARSEESHCFQF